jgi:ChrR Cupin-like domain
MTEPERLQHDDCFCDLAALCALDLLDDRQRLELEAYLAESEELASELAWDLTEFEKAAAAIAYDAPVVPMVADLKQRLFDGIGEMLPETEDKAIDPNLWVPPLIVRSHQVDWQPHSIPGVEVGGLYIDEETREITCFVRIAPGIRYPLHQHAGVEEVLMLEGDLVVGDEVCLAGDYIRCIPGSAHDPITYEGCKLFIRSSLDDRILVEC